MPATAFDVVVVGAVFIGNAIAYHLARPGVTVLLLEAKSLGSGSSGACGGRAQVAEGHLTITTTPILTELIAGMILGEPTVLSLDSFNPARFASV